MIDQVEQIRRAHKSAKPNSAANPAWANCHHDCGVLLAEIDRLVAALDEICVKGRNPIAEKALGMD